jgi:GNAT superfamily N-acetyltransferase
MFDVVVGDHADDLDKQLSAELDRVNTAATPGVAPQRELTVEIRNRRGELLAGLSGWSWGTSAGIAMLWVLASEQRSGLGGRLLSEAEAEARKRGCAQMFVSSFTFQAPAFYEKHGYVEFARLEGLPQPPHADVHLSKQLLPATS